jgi:hypothetical protein
VQCAIAIPPQVQSENFKDKTVAGRSWLQDAPAPKELAGEGPGAAKTVVKKFEFGLVALPHMLGAKDTDWMQIPKAGEERVHEEEGADVQIFGQRVCKARLRACVLVQEGRMSVHAADRTPDPVHSPHTK